MKSGRKRKFNKSIPAHIQQEKLPNGCYWDNSGKGHWYRSYLNEAGAQRRKRIAGPLATLAELHRLMEDINGVDRNTFNWISEQFMTSKIFKSLAKSTRRDYLRCNSIIANHPTKSNVVLGDAPLNKWTTVIVRTLIDKVSERIGPSTANHVLRYLRRLLKWCYERGFVVKNYANGVSEVKESPKQQYVSDENYNIALEYAKSCAKLGINSKGSCPDYLWAVMEIAYKCRLRGIEVLDLRQSSVTEEGLICGRRKNSRTNITIWDSRLRAAVSTLTERRDQIWKKKKMPVPLNFSDWPLVVTKFGTRLEKSSLESTWQRFINKAMEQSIIQEEQRFSLHDLKRKGISDTVGTRADKQEASGHRSARMMDTYDKSIPLVEPAKHH